MGGGCAPEQGAGCGRELLESGNRQRWGQSRRVSHPRGPRFANETERCAASGERCQRGVLLDEPAHVRLEVRRNLKRRPGARAASRGQRVAEQRQAGGEVPRVPPDQRREARGARPRRPLLPLEPGRLQPRALP